MDRIGRYKIVRELGRGAMGVVYHAIDPNIGRPVAIKTINLGAVPKAEDQERMRERLFYVAMTRAEDTLAIYAKQGKGTDTRPTKFLREFMGASAHSKFWRPLQAAAVQDELFAAAEEERVAIQHSNVAAWLLGEPSANFVTGLSASAIDTYEQCPLRFKLEREWNLPRDVPAALHYRAAMH